MLTAKPTEVFSLAGKRILTCRVVGQNPLAFIGKDLYYYAGSGKPKRIHIEGMSTAYDIQRSEYDFSYTGDEVLASEISEQALVAEELCETGLPTQASLAKEETTEVQSLPEGPADHLCPPDFSKTLT